MAGVAEAARMPLLTDVVPAALELAYLIDVAGGLEAASLLLRANPGHLVAMLTGQRTALLTLATRRLYEHVWPRTGWSVRAAEHGKARTASVERHLAVA